MTVTAIIQARLGSTRLPGKTLMDIAGVPLLGHLLMRVRAAKRVDRIIIATTLKPMDDRLARFAHDEGLDCFRGDEDDVLDRFYGAATLFDARTIVRVTPDCPMLDPGIVDRVIGAFQDEGPDYASNTIKPTYPDGMDVEVFSYGALRRAWKEARLPSEREHVTPYMKKHPDIFRLTSVEGDRDLSGLRLTVDEERDLAFAKEVFSRLYAKDRLFRLGDILKLLEEEPGLLRINQDIGRNEGYEKSLRRDALLRRETMKGKQPSLDKSVKLLSGVRGLIPGSSQTFSKGPTQFSEGAAPNFLASGKGCRVTDVDGNSYIDYSMALGAVTLGYSYPAVNRAIAAQMKDGMSFTLPHSLEYELAKKLAEIIPCAEMARFGKNGSDATSGAVRAARAITGREVVACCGYHGWQDWYIGTTTRDKGVPKAVKRLTRTFGYNDLSSLEKIFRENKDNVACVIMEPTSVVRPDKGFLEGVKKLARKNGALLIFDEVVTGFRLSTGGAQEYFGVTPDMACFGKGMGNGMPISAVVGRKKYMKVFDEIFFSFTFGGETLSMAASLAVIDEMKAKDVPGHMAGVGQRLMDGYNRLAMRHGLENITSCFGYPCRNVVGFKDGKGDESLLIKTFFQQEAVARGVLFCGYHNLSLSHKAGDINETLTAYDGAMAALKDALDKRDVKRRLRGPVLRAVFRKI